VIKKSAVTMAVRTLLITGQKKATDKTVAQLKEF
jgi:hypothetical protein